MKIKLDHRAMERVLKSRDVREFLHEHADPIAADVALNPAVTRLRDAEVYTRDFTSDRAVVDVVLDSVDGVPVEAKYRVITATAEAAGLDVDRDAPESVLFYTTKAGKRRKASAAQIANWTRGSR